MKNQRVKLNKSPFAITLLVILILYTLSLILCYTWGFFTSVKDQYYFLLENKIWPIAPWKWNFNNYVYVFTNFKISISGKGYVDVFSMIINSVLYAVGNAFIQTSVCCFMAYLVAKFDYKLSKVIYWIVIVAMTIPIVGSDISSIQILLNFNMYDTFIGNYIQKFNFMGMYFLVFHASFYALPNDYAEAACVDGAGETRTFLSIIFPLMLNMFFTVFLINFITYWNDFQSPLLYLPTHPTLAYGVYFLTNTNINGFSDTPHRLAVCMVVIFPVIVLFILFKNRIMNNLSIGGIKE